MSELLDIPIEDLMPDPGQPRQTFLKEEIDRLADSIAARGVLLPLRVLWDAERQKWRIVVGECRWRAARQARRTHVPCLPIVGEVSEADILSDQIMENVARTSLKPMERARGLSRLKALKRCTASQLAKEVGISTAELSRTERLLTLPTDIQALVDSGAVPESTAYEIALLSDERTQREIASDVAAGRLKRADVKEKVREEGGGRGERPSGSRLSRKLDGLSITVSAGRSLTQADVRAAIAFLNKELKKLPPESDADASVAQAS